jgi:dihydrolipoamide dehydrogenase
VNNIASKIAILVIIGVLVYLYFAFNIGQYLTLEFVKAQQSEFERYYAEHRTITILTYMAVYILMAAVSIPGATIMTLAAGVMFGLLLGTVLVSFASTIGATLAFLIARFLLQDTIQNKFRDKLKTINAGVEKDGAFYLFTLRLIAAFPFFLINLVMGLTRIPTFKFFWVSQLGMLPGTLVYVNAGTQLGQIESVEGILSPGLILSFALLGIFPLLTKNIVGFLRSRMYMRRYAAPKTYDYNLIAIGAGSGGLVAAYIAAAVKAKAALVEKDKMGGDCLNTGCVPSKALLRSAKVLSYAKRANEFGFRGAQIDFDFGEVMERVQRVIRKVAPHDSVERYTSLGVDCFLGDARIVSPYQVEVDGKTLSTRNIIIATGARPLVPSIPGLESVGYLTSDSIWDLRKLPNRLLVLGGGPIGCELAQCFQRFGSQVTIVEQSPVILSKEDEDVSDAIAAKFRKEDVRLLLNHKVTAFSDEGQDKSAICQSEGKLVTVGFDAVLLALGRRANIDGLGLQELDVRVSDRGTIEADSFLRTNYPNIFVCGDVTGPYQFTHTASHQAWYAAVNALFSPFKKFRVDYGVTPWCTFTDPEVAHVGLNERQAKADGVPYEVSKYEISDLDRAIAEDEDYGFVKVLTVPGKDKILGATIVGAHAGEVIVEFVAAMRHGFGLNKILGTIHIYPTFGEANKYAAGVWKKAHAPRTALRWLEKFHAWRRGDSGRSDEGT